MTNKFLLEIGSEELPPKTLTILASALQDGVIAGLDKAELNYNSAKFFAAPRRLSVLIEGIQTAQQDKAILRKGPSVAAAFNEEGQPTPAAMGFAKSCGVSVNELDTLEEGKGKWLSYHVEQKGRTAKELLPEIIIEAVRKLPIAKPMRWGDYDVQFVRPVHWILMILNEEVIPSTILGKVADGYTYGHRFHHPEAIKVSHADQYLEKLKPAYVIADFNERKEIIKAEIGKCANQCNGHIIENEALLNEVTAIVEWPHAVLVNFDKQFLDVPREALIESMASHQKCFSLQDSNGHLLPYFITVSNIQPQDDQHIITGNERVMRARLSDAAFFYEKDKKSSLEHKAFVLKDIIFQKKLGSLQDKVERMERLAVSLLKQLECNQENIIRAVQLSKASLVTEMVGEFPSLQDVMGYYYARYDGENEEVAQALKEQYLPRFSGDDLPNSKVGSLLALVERVDTLVGIFGIGQKPTGEKDPFQLRRSALGTIRILLEKKLEISLPSLIEQGISAYDLSLENDNLYQDVLQFCSDRLYVYLTNHLGYRSDVVKAVMTNLDLPLSDIVERIKVLQSFIGSSIAEDLVQSFKRVGNILKASDANLIKGDVEPDLFETEQEKALHHASISQDEVIAACINNKEYSRVLDGLVQLKPPVDDFFNEVMVNVEDPALRMNRLVLLSNLKKLFNQFADISLIQ